VARGDRVVNLSHRRHPALDALGVTQHESDVADPEAVVRAAQGCEIIFQVAARAGLGGRYRDYYRSNLVGTENTLAACRRLGLKCLVYTSSPSVVFDGQDMEGVNESAPYASHFLAAYPRTKALAEQVVRAADGPCLATVALRPHLIWGPGDNHLIPRLVARARAGRLRRIGRASKRIDSVYIDNAAEAHILAADRLSPGSPIAGKVYFITNGEPLPVWDFVNRILAAAGLGPVSRSVPFSLAYAAGWALEKVYALLPGGREPPMTRFLAKELATAHWFDISAARRDLDYEPTVSIDEGLRRLAKHLAAG
jgi:nucleoside-diphosphate-sugar epimerase